MLIPSLNQTSCLLSFMRIHMSFCGMIPLCKWEEVENSWVSSTISPTAESCGGKQTEMEKYGRRGRAACTKFSQQFFHAVLKVFCLFCAIFGIFARFWSFLSHILCANFSGSKVCQCYFVGFFHLWKQSLRALVKLRWMFGFALNCYDMASSVDTRTVYINVQRMPHYLAATSK